GGGARRPVLSTGRFRRACGRPARPDARHRKRRRVDFPRPAMVDAQHPAALDAVRVLIVDDHDLFRAGLRTLLEEQGVHVVGEASGGAEAVQLVSESAPDVVVMDLNMPGMTGVEATRQISALAPLTRVVVLTISDQ